jgi:uroporphyrinogen-III synthase
VILLPRPASQLPRTVAALRRAGFGEVLPLAIAAYQPLDLAELPRDATALLLTSAAALTTLLACLRRAGPLAGRPGCLRFLPAYCVGAATARAARRAGLNVVFTGRGDGAALARAIIRQGLTGQHFLHLHADNAAAPWAADLERAGHKVTGTDAYRTAYIHALPAEVAARLRRNPPTHTLLFSPAAARRLSALLADANIPPAGTALALSPAVAAAARLYWPTVAAAARPSLPGLMAALKTQQGPQQGEGR